MAKKQHKLDVKLEKDAFAIIAVVTSFNDIRMCSYLNELFSIALQRQKNIDLTINKKVIQPSYFSCFNNTKLTKITLIDNQYEEGFVLDFMKNITFFIKISPIFNKDIITNFIEETSKNTNFSFVQEINTEKFTGKQLNSYNTLFLPL